MPCPPCPIPMYVETGSTPPPNYNIQYHQLATTGPAQTNYCTMCKQIELFCDGNRMDPLTRMFLEVFSMRFSRGFIRRRSPLLTARRIAI
jgi:hypothetical protein